MRNLTQDGGFSPWAPWQPCNHDDGEGSVSSCACRSRSCDGPVARCGGVECKGPTIQVANCSRYICCYLVANISQLLTTSSAIKRTDSWVTCNHIYVSSLTPCSSGMAAGLPGHHGASAAAVVASGLKWGSGPATTPRLATVAESASARVERRGEEEHHQQPSLLHGIV